MTTAFIVNGQSNARGQWKTPDESEAFPEFGVFPRCGSTCAPTVPGANDAATGWAFWPYVAHLISSNKSGYRAQFFNSAVGGSGLVNEWNGGPGVDKDDPGWDPNNYYASSTANALNRGRNYDAQYVLFQWGNADATAAHDQATLEFAMEAWLDYWLAQGVAGGLMGSTVVAGTFNDTRPTYMREVWEPACRAVVRRRPEAYIGALLSEAVNYDSTGFTKADNVHFNYDMNFIAGKEWARAIEKALL